MTTLNYLNNTYQYTDQATLFDIRDHERGTALILDQTIFYPQGGGQPADQGMINTEKGTFTVQDVRLDADGIVWHFGAFEGSAFDTNSALDLTIDQEKRDLHARLHSAGHLLDCAIAALDIQGLTPNKGFHFSTGPYVEYHGILEEPRGYMQAIENMINELVKADLRVSKHMLPPEEAAERGIWAPPGKEARVVQFGDFPEGGCGGTHVNSASEIGRVTIRKVSSKKGVTRVAYALE